MQTRAVCFGCDEVIEYDPIFEAPCGHDEHSSAVWHGICLMRWRDHRDDFIKQWRQRFRRMMEEMGADFGDDDE